MTAHQDPAWPSAATGLLAVIGHPVAHSLSPAMHNAALVAANLDIAYVAVDVAPARLDDALQGLGALGFTGANVTVPHKRAVAARCDTLSDEARLVGAVNTVVVRGDGLHGHNTDTIGFLAGLPADLPAGRAVVLGAGGAARAVVVALARTGWTVEVVARRPAAAEGLVEEVAQGLGRMGGETSLHGGGREAMAGAVAAADLVVNATPLGLDHEHLPPAFMALRADQVAYDLVYNPAVTPFLAAADTAGAVAINGLAMLVGQAAAAFEAWTGVAPDREVMRGAAMRVLERA